MTDDFKPSIKSRTTEELLAIAGAPKKWNERALKLALNELYNRKVDTKLIDHAKYVEKRQLEFEALQKATKSYQISDFIFNLKGTLFELIFTWELKKDGYLLKAQQQKTFRISLIVVILLVYLLKELLPSTT
ncbi:hypothetical protein [Flavobacterium cellulosilyticum]|uniref:Uncharacterized protein n=1 Tax=Flavobacterium cellulosilyticum TaxID=2541731 RepID=A0A4R5CH11_9FLAO|nr:hypothetical protein [Flavobacterium cellulosilyticum]TDD96562.1 hypothetical protein E0F76_11170 [Flavobacterium cellulosilyticum]